MIEFGPFRLQPDQQLLLRDGQPVRVGSRALQILVELIARPGEVVSKEQLMARVWPNQFVEDGNLKVNVAALRKALGDGDGGRRYIINIPGRGYSFVGKLTSPEETRTEAFDGFEEAIALSSHRTPVLGRSAAIEHITNEVQHHRFVTIVGPGGIGKTTVALAAADRLKSTMPDGIHFIDLAPLTDPSLVPSALASALGVAVRSEGASRNLASFLGDKRLLIVLDNCEHVVEAAAVLAEDVAGAPNAHILATSREPLRGAGERVYRLPPLEIPSAAEGLTASEALRFPAVRLFVERAAASLDGFELRDRDVVAVTEACRKLDGIALAIELTASRIAAFGVNGLASLLDDRFNLSEGRRTAQPRHQTLGATLDWSYALLSEHERVTLRRAAVFAGAFTLDAGRAILPAIDGPASNVGRNIANLVAKSLVVAFVDRPKPVYRLLDTTRGYARNKLTEAGETDRVALRHAQYFETVLRQAAADWEVQPAAVWIDTHRGMIDDVRSALDWAFGPNGDLAVGTALTVAALPLWFQLSLISECLERVERALAGPAESRAAEADLRLHAALGWSLMQTRGSVIKTRDAWTRVLELAEQLGSIDYQLRALWGLWAGLLNRSELQPALLLAQRFQSVAERRRDADDRYVGDRMIGYTQHLLGDQDIARFHIERMLDHYQTPVSGADIIRYVFDQRVTARCFLARILWLQGFPEQAVRLAEDIIRDTLAGNDTLSLCQALVQAACPVAVFVGRLDLLQTYVKLLLDHSGRSSLVFWQTWGHCFEALLKVKSGKGETGLAELREALGGLRKIDYGVYYITFLGEFAQALCRSGKPDQGLIVIDEALHRSEGNHERWYLPELLRIRGEIILRQGVGLAEQLAEREYLLSLDCSRERGTLSWELRTCVSLHRLWSQSGRGHEARDLLSSVLGRFTEGFESADVLHAVALLKVDNQSA